MIVINKSSHLDFVSVDNSSTAAVVSSNNEYQLGANGNKLRIKGGKREIKSSPLKSVTESGMSSLTSYMIVGTSSNSPSESREEFPWLSDDSYRVLASRIDVVVVRNDTTRVFTKADVSPGKINAAVHEVSAILIESEAVNGSQCISRSVNSIGNDIKHTPLDKEDAEKQKTNLPHCDNGSQVQQLIDSAIQINLGVTEEVHVTYRNNVCEKMETNGTVLLSIVSQTGVDFGTTTVTVHVNNNRSNVIASMKGNSHIIATDNNINNVVGSVVQHKFNAVMKPSLVSCKESYVPIIKYTTNSNFDPAIVTLSCSVTYSMPDSVATITLSALFNQDYRHLVECVTIQASLSSLCIADGTAVRCKPANGSYSPKTKVLTWSSLASNTTDRDARVCPIVCMAKVLFDKLSLDERIAFPSSVPVIVSGICQHLTVTGTVFGIDDESHSKISNKTRFEYKYL